MKLAELTWKEIAERLESERRLIVPVGTCEQHGPHLPLSSDTLVAESIAEYLSQRTGILVAPTVQYGVNLPCDRGFAGTCSTTPELLRGTIGSILEWWKVQGFARFFLLSAHGDPLHIEALRAADPDAARVLSLYDFPMQDILERQEGGRHACEAETSVMLHLRPELVRTEEIADFAIPFDEFKPYFLHEKIEPIAGAPGHQGFPSFASAEKGERIFALMKRHALSWLERGGEA
ncbi:MAG: creatininase family protein [Candidatus Aminicenantes bacterium]|nr:creatininase family protein [Candidatus Aminicenantes bacterium]